MKVIELPLPLLYFSKSKFTLKLFSTSCKRRLSKPPYKTSCTSPVSNKTRNIDKFTIFCNTKITKYGRNGQIQEAESIFHRMPFRNTISYTAMLTAFADNGYIKKARKVFDEMPHRSTATWNAMITAYVRNGCDIEAASELFTQMPEKNSVSYASMITGFVRAGMMDDAEKLFSVMPVFWREPICSNTLINGYLKMDMLEEAAKIFDGMAERDLVSWSSMVDGYCKKGSTDKARELFENMPERNVITWTAMIDGYMKTGCFEDGFLLFVVMRQEVVLEVNSTTLSVLFEACGSHNRYWEGYQIHGLVLCMGLECDVFLGNSILMMYCKFGRIDAANKVFQMMSKKDIVSWNSLIAGYVQNGEVEEAYEFFEKMMVKDVISWTTMISGFSSKGIMDKSVELFNMMPSKDDVAWTVIISGFVNNDEYEDAIHWYIQMVQQGVKPNSVTLSSVLSASAGMAALIQGLQFHAHAVKMHMDYDLHIQNSIVSMYAKCGNLSDACQIFANIQAPNVVSYNSMITGFAQHGDGGKVLQLFKKMQNEGLEINHVTFLGVLSACSHLGLLEEGRNYFHSMKALYQIEPGPDHYACMVDLLSRAGLLDEAIELVNLMPVEPHSGVWGALLGASMMHSNLDLAKLAALQLFKLEPFNATPYVVLSNMYSSVCKKKDEAQIRGLKTIKGVKKSPGCSWIIDKGVLHMFCASDQSHAMYEQIRATLCILALDLRHWDCYHI